MCVRSLAGRFARARLSFPKGERTHICHLSDTPTSSWGQRKWIPNSAFSPRRVGAPTTKLTTAGTTLAVSSATPTPRLGYTCHCTTAQGALPSSVVKAFSRSVWALDALVKYWSFQKLPTKLDPCDAARRGKAWSQRLSPMDPSSVPVTSM